MEKLKKLWREWRAAEQELHDLRRKASEDKDGWPMAELDAAKAKERAAFDAFNAEIFACK